MKDYKSSLSDYSDEELYEILKKNNHTSTPVLACICSEVLRRMLKEKYDGKN